MNKKRRQKNSGGQSIIELAITLPLLMVLSFSGYWLAMGLYTYNKLVSATVEGAKYASFATDPGQASAVLSGAQTRTQLVLTNSGVPWWDPDVNVTASYSQATPGGGNMYYFLQVDASTAYPSLIPGVEPMNLSARSVGYACVNCG